MRLTPQRLEVLRLLARGEQPTTKAHRKVAGGLTWSRLVAAEWNKGRIKSFALRPLARALYDLGREDGAMQAVEVEGNDYYFADGTNVAVSTRLVIDGGRETLEQEESE